MFYENMTLKCYSSVFRVNCNKLSSYTHKQGLKVNYIMSLRIKVQKLNTT